MQPLRGNVTYELPRDKRNTYLECKSGYVQGFDNSLNLHSSLFEQINTGHMRLNNCEPRRYDLGNSL